MSAGLRLVRAGRVFAPRALGRKDVLIGGGRVLAVTEPLAEADIAVLARAGGLAVLERPQGTLLPGLLDQHMHFLGGGEGDGPGARMADLTFEEIVAGGTTTAVGMLGTEIRCKTLSLLLARAGDLAQRGLTSFICTGAMALPPPSLLGDVVRDIMLIDRVIGAKSAVAERLFPNTDEDAWATLAGEIAQARAVTGKAAVLVVHVGRRPEGIGRLLVLAERLGLDADQVVPTHVNRAATQTPVFAQGLGYARAGGVIDFTCCLGPRDGLPGGMDIVEAVGAAVSAGVPPGRITLSSDAGVAVPDQDRPGRFRSVPPAILFRDIRRLALEAGLGWDGALPFATTNVARLLRLGDRKGAIAAGLDADLVLLDAADCIDTVLAMGRIVHGSAEWSEIGRAPPPPLDRLPPG